MSTSSHSSSLSFHSPKKSPSWKDFEAQCHHCIKNKESETKISLLSTAILRIHELQGVSDVPHHGLSKLKHNPLLWQFINLKIMQSILTFYLRRFYNKQVYGCDQTAKGFFSYCEAYFSYITNYAIIQKAW